jgi:hypothetical protein
MSSETDFSNVSYDARFESEKSWAFLVTEWTSRAIDYHDLTARVVGVIAQNFPTSHIYKLEANKIKLKRAIQAGIPRFNELIFETDEFKGARNQTPEQKEKMRQRKIAFQKIDLLYHRLGREVLFLL